MKKIILGVMVAVSLLACSKEQVIEVNRANDEITFSVVTDAITRGYVYSSTELPQKFHVYANHNGRTYMSDHHVELIDGVYVNSDGVHYWPEEGDVTFYAYQTGGEMHWVSGEVPTMTFKVQSKVEEQLDFIYAVKSQCKDDNAPVALNFRHALSQVVFQAKNTNPGLYVEVYGVSVCNVGATNLFTFATDDTDKEISATTQGTWNSLTGGTADYSISFDSHRIHGNNTVVELGKSNAINATMLLLPQTTTAWVPNTPATYETGSYFIVNCKIFNVAGDVYTNDDVCLHNGPVAIPASFSWEQGKKYIYTFVFGNSTGGYEPGTTNPVLTPIEFTLTIDDFIPATETNTDMKTE
jgi:hypothetical protein